MPGKFHGRRCLAVYSPQGRKESDTTEQLLFKKLPVVLTCISLIPNDVELFFPCYAISLSSLEKYILTPFVYFRLFIIELWKLTCSLSVNSAQGSDCGYSLLLCGLCFQFPVSALQCTEVLNFDEVQFVYLFVAVCAFWCHIHKIIPNPVSWRFFFQYFQDVYSFSS